MVSLRLAPAELMLTTSLLILVPGIASPSLVDRWLEHHDRENQFGRQQSMDEFRYATPQSFSLSAVKDLEEVIA